MSADQKQKPTAPPGLEVTPVEHADLPAIKALHAACFGPGRFARTAYRIRENTPEISPYCRKARDGDRLLAAIRYTPVTIGGHNRALLLGPLAVTPEFAGAGIGARLVRETLDAATAAGECVVLLVGDLSYYGRFGFAPVSPGTISLPGPVDPARLLMCRLPHAADRAWAGEVRPNLT